MNRLAQAKFFSRLTGDTKKAEETALH